MYIYYIYCIYNITCNSFTSHYPSDAKRRVLSKASSAKPKVSENQWGEATVPGTKRTGIPQNLRGTSRGQRWGG